MTPAVKAFFDPATWTVTYVVYEAAGTPCAIIDPVLDYDPKSGRTSSASAQRVAAFVRTQRLEVAWILETHAHADHLSAAAWLRGELGGQVAIGHDITVVQRVFKQLFNLEEAFATDGSQFDYLALDGDRLRLGALEAEVIAMPGHTPACVAYRIGDSVFVGDTLFMPDAGTARCDFPGGSAQQLFRSVRKLLTLPEATRLFMCHDYPPTGREVKWQTTVGEERAGNIHVRDGIAEEQFVAMRTARDATLAMPVLILPAVQVNIRAGQFPPPEGNGVSYLKIPLNVLGAR